VPFVFPGYDLATINFLLSGKNGSSTQNFISANSSLVCDNYWFEIIEEDGGKWLYEYCGDKIISISPIDDDD
jgi:hypothetical protein